MKQTITRFINDKAGIMYGNLNIMITLITGMAVWIVGGPIVDEFDNLLRNSIGEGMMSESLMAKIDMAINLWEWMPIIMISIAVLYGYVRSLRKTGQDEYI